MQMKKQMKMKMVVTADYGNHKWMLNEDGSYRKLWQPQMNVKCLWAWSTQLFMKISFEVAVEYTDNKFEKFPLRVHDSE